MFLLGGRLIVWLSNKRWRKDVQSQAEAWQVREDTPETHQKKQGTPSMGGIGIIGVACGVYGSCVTTLLIISIAQQGRLSELPEMLFNVFAIPIVAMAHAGLGFGDDWSKASGRGGLRARAKLLGQVCLGLLFIFSLIVFLNLNSSTFMRESWQETALILRYSNWVTVSFLVSILLIVMIGTGNAANITDGIDGLATGLAVQAGFSLILIQTSLRDSSAPSIWFWAALAGSCLGFLSYNKYPAKVFMGDTGSLALGAAVGAGAIMCHAVFLLPFIAFIYFVEMFSVTLQVLYFKWTKKKYGEGRRIFRRAPLHHHFELGGWSEWRVVGTFWAVNLVTSIIGLILWHAGILPRFP